ncbi:MAG: hypothetical protein HYU41_12715 [Candidatus Rokubacteria bacterium]|nr:hypothetical protein [Candidatus Rokubacteria bacterium]
MIIGWSGIAAVWLKPRCRHAPDSEKIFASRVIAARPGAACALQVRENAHRHVTCNVGWLMMRSSRSLDGRTRPARRADRSIICAACGATVARDEPVAPRADDVVHAQCHPVVIAFERARAAAR